MTSSTTGLLARPSAVRRRASAGRAARGHGPLGLVLSLPALVMVVGIFVIPIAISAWMSVSTWPLLGDHSYAGWENYVRVLSDPAVRRSFVFTIAFAGIVTPVVLLLGLGLALLVRKPRAGTGAIRTGIFAPVVVGTAASSYLWLALTNPSSGLLNRFFVDTGLTSEPINWLLTRPTAVALVVVVTVWRSAGFSMIVLMNGLNSVPVEVEEAALVDGASAARIMWSIKLPLMKDSIAFVTTFTLIGALLTFDQFYIITGGGPNSSTVSAVYTIYSTAFTQLNLGYASAISIVFMIAILIITMLQFRLVGRGDER